MSFWWNKGVSACLGFVFASLFAVRCLASSFEDIEGLERELEAMLAVEPDDKILESLDRLALLKLDWLAETLLERVKRTQSESFDKVLAAYALYEKEKSLYGTPKDRKRTLEYRNFIAAAKSISEKTKSNRISIREKIARLSRLKFLPVPAVKLLFLLMHSDFRNTARGLKRLFPILEEVSPAFLPKGIEWDGRDLIQDGEFLKSEIRLIVMNHAHHHLDNLVMASVLAELDGDSIIIAAAHGWSHDHLAHWAMQNEGLVQVGERNGIKNPNSIDKILQRLQGGARNLFVYPEGSTGGGIGELKPIAPGFSQRLLPRLLQNFKVSLLVLTTIDTYSKLGDKSPREGPARVKIGPVFRDQELRELIQQNKLDNRIRSVWMRNLPTDEERILGEYRAKNLLRSLGKCPEAIEKTLGIFED